MGVCLGVQAQFSCDATLNYMSSCLCGDKNFILSLKTHVKSLQSALDEIKARREDLLRRVQVEEMKGLKRLAEVRLWLSNVKNIILQVEDKLKTSDAEIQKLCICGYCSKGLCSSYTYSVEVWSMLEQVQDLFSKGKDFHVVAEKYVITKVEGIPIDPTISQSTMVESTWNILMEDRVGCLGLYGIPGVGKTTLLSQINNEFLNKENDFDVVIRVVVPKDQNIPSIQEELGKRLEIYDEEWVQKTENEKAFDINRVLRKKRYMLLLDDMLAKVDVRKIGVPLPTLGNRSKIAFTTRHKEVCSDMAVDEKKEVTRLDDDAAWVLFQERVGKDLIRRNPDIAALAIVMCKKCCGLPIVINAIGQTMACKNSVGEWQDAITSLGSIITEISSESCSSLAEFSREEDIIMSILKFSYNNLEDHKVKRCFRYYALFPENYEMKSEELIEFWECEGVVTRRLGHRVLNELVSACLLMESEGKVKMHDVVRKMALLEAPDIGEPEESIVVKTDERLVQIPDDLKWDVLKRMSLINNVIKEISGSPSTPNLTTLLLRNQILENISSKFFDHMQSLLVLDLSLNRSLNHLPATISNLVSLRYLNLSGTGIELLSIGLEQLIYLNLEHTSMLQSIIGISTLLNLSVLRLGGSGFRPNLNFIEELKRLEHISVLTISLSDEAVLKSFFGSHGLAIHTQGLYIEGFATKGEGISIVATSSCLQTLEIFDSNIKEIHFDSILPAPQESPSSALFEKLREVKLYGCNGPKHLTWLLFAPNLLVLHVERVKDIEEILSKEKADSVMKVQAELTPFGKLKAIVFEDLQNLKSIYESPLPFTYLSKISIRRCPKLKKLPFDSGSANGGKLVIDAEFNWIQQLDWEDEDTRERFFPS